MTPEKRQLVVTIEILRVLADCQGLLIPEDALLNQCRLSIKPVLLESEFTAALRHQEAMSHVTGIRPQLGGPTKWQITDKGRAAFADS